LINFLIKKGCDVPDWVLKLSKVDKKKLKHLKKYPEKRDTISTKIKKNIDPEFIKQIKIQDK